MRGMVQTAPVRPRTWVRRSAKPQWWRWTKIAILILLIGAVIYQGWVVFRVFRFKSTTPSTAAVIEQRAAEARAAGEEPKRIQTWVPYDRISRNLTRAVLAGEDSRYFDHAGFDWEEMRKALEE